MSTLLALVLLSGAAAQFQPYCDPGRDGQVIVHLFEWKWSDIAQECEKVLGPKGFCGVQVSIKRISTLIRIDLLPC